jgi:UDP-3-O-[3-hydroxymyristoyl] glucosamine N-acyltransferase
MTVRQIAELLGASFEGDGGREIRGGASVEAAAENEITFAEGGRGSQGATASSAGCLLVPRDAPGFEGRTLIRVDRPRNAFARVLRELYPPVLPAPGVHPTAVVDESAHLGSEVSIGPYCVVGREVRVGDRSVLESGASIGEGVKIGSGCRLHPGVVVYPRVRLGDRVILHAGAVIGADGFGYAHEGGRWEKFPQIGTVEIGDDVEIGAQSCVVRAALGATVIGAGTKLDNMVHIGHNCRLGKHVVIAAQTGLSGGVVVEDCAVIGGQVGIGDKARIETGAVLGSGCGVLPSKTIHRGEVVWGTPARPRREYLEKLALLNRLPEFIAEIKRLAQRLSRLEGA